MVGEMWVVRRPWFMFLRVGRNKNDKLKKQMYTLLQACHFLQHRKLVFPSGLTQGVKLGCRVCQQGCWPGK
jgi:hypothetical protein